MTSLPKHKPIHIHSFIYYTSLMLLNFHSLFNLLVLFKVIGKPDPTGLLRVVQTVNLYILVSSCDSFKREK